ncbi:hypothetical protein [Hallella colorans]|uniref:hypothetical protein n=1 Tax=Hallella colorans TaxID=1703337 RepID=UPI00288AA319|nr:hypothetical protein [Hallella colorans]
MSRVQAAWYRRLERSNDFSSNMEYAIKIDDHFAQTPGFDDFTGLGIVDFYPVVHSNS